MTDLQIQDEFLTWWMSSYPLPPGQHALMTHTAWARHLLKTLEHDQQQREVER